MKGFGCFGRKRVGWGRGGGAFFFYFLFFFHFFLAWPYYDRPFWEFFWRIGGRQTANGGRRSLGVLQWSKDSSVGHAGSFDVSIAGWSFFLITRKTIPQQKNNSRGPAILGCFFFWVDFLNHFPFTMILFLVCALSSMYPYAPNLFPADQPATNHVALRFMIHPDISQVRSFLKAFFAQKEKGL